VQVETPVPPGFAGSHWKGNGRRTAAPAAFSFQRSQQSAFGIQPAMALAGTGKSRCLAECWML